MLELLRLDKLAFKRKAASDAIATVNGAQRTRA